VSAGLRTDSLWRYAATTDNPEDGSAPTTTWALERSPAPDGTWPCAFAPAAGREETVALRRDAILGATFTLADEYPGKDTDLVRLQRTGVLYSVTGVTPVPRAREVLVMADSVDRAAYPITDDVPAYTVSTVGVSGPATLTVGTRRRFTATLLSQAGANLNDRPVRWQSSDNNVVLIDATGMAEALTAGTATITATVDGVSGDAPVTVQA
jgi:hypothetical protein